MDFKEIIKTNQNNVKSIIRLITKENNEDLEQEVYIKVWKNSEKYQEKGFEVLDFPCNQFLNQAPGTNEEIAEFCQLRFGAKFRTFGKIKVNGQDAEPLYKYLKENSKGSFFGNEIKWNFTKFLIDREGNIVKRYAPTTKPEDLEEDIKNLL